MLYPDENILVTIFTFQRVFFFAVAQFTVVTPGMKVNIGHSSMRILRTSYNVKAARGRLGGYPLIFYKKKLRSRGEK